MNLRQSASSNLKIPVIAFGCLISGTLLFRFFYQSTYTRRHLERASKEADILYENFKLMQHQQILKEKENNETD